VKIEWFEKKSAGRNGAPSSGVVVTQNRNGNSSNTYVRLGVDVLKKCRFMAGDKVNVGVASSDAKKFLIIKRDPKSEGYTISSARGKKGYGSSDISGTIKMKSRGIPSFEAMLSDCRIDEVGTLFIPFDG